MLVYRCLTNTRSFTFFTWDVTVSLKKIYDRFSLQFMLEFHSYTRLLSLQKKNLEGFKILYYSNQILLHFFFFNVFPV